MAQLRLRPYQDECNRRLLAAHEEGARSALVVAATGLGKTVMMADLARRWIADRRHGKVLMIAHREELVFQGQQKLEQVTGSRFDIEMGDFRAAGAPNGEMFGHAAGVVASVASLCQANRLRKYRPENYGLLLVDEAHHAVPKCVTYRKIIEHFRRNPGLYLVGVTATPDRADEEALGQVFESCPFEYGILEAVGDGWLVPPRQRLVVVEDLDFSGVGLQCGDLKAGELEQILTEEKILHRVVSPTIDLIGSRPTIVFTAGVKQAHDMADVFNRHRAGMAVAMDGQTDKDERRAYLRRFRRGEVQVLINCDLFTEGFDAPNVACVVMARPTKSRALYCQILGRGTRPLPEADIDSLETADERRMAIATSRKPDCLVIDFVGNAGRHKLVHAADVLGGRISDEVVERAKRIAEQRSGQGLDTDVQQALREALEAAQERKRQERRQIIAKARYVAKDIDPFDLLDVAAGREPGYLRGKRATPKQIAFLRAAGVRNVERLSLHKASRLIEEIKRRDGAGLCTARQAELLARYGYPTDVTRDEASRMIAEINARIAHVKTAAELPTGFVVR